jgi:putative membrane-bound dehydrogenase-like protein
MGTATPSARRSVALVGLLTTVALATAPTTAQDPTAFDVVRLSDAFLAEGAAVGDLDRDGHLDLVAGTSVWLGPDQTRRVDLGDVLEVDPLEYSSHFLSWVEDVDGDGWPDVVTVGFPGREARWLRNPGGPLGESAWSEHLIHDEVSNESPAFADLDGDGRRELVFFSGGRAVWATPDPLDPTAPWRVHPISGDEGFGVYEHGLGVGDLDGDGRADVLDRLGWWQQPAGGAGDQPWERHRVDFAAGRRGGAQMLVSDVDGDGHADVVTSLDGHGWGLSWFEQQPQGDRTGATGEASPRSEPTAGASAPTFVEHRIMDSRPADNPYGVAVSQLHALALADMDGDGVDDVVTGKRWWAHGPSGDPGSGQPALLLWFRCVRDEDGVRFVPRVIDASSGVGTQVTVDDVDADGRPDVVVANKTGVHLFRQRNALAIAPPEPPVESLDEVGILPRGRDGELLDLGFESGDLSGWTAEGEAFAGQPVRGDTVSARGREASLHQGDHWAGGYELHGDDPHGSLISDAFMVTHPWASFLVGGGAWPETRVDIVRVTDGAVLHRSMGANHESLQRVVVDLREHMAQWIAVQVVDERSGHWGHINYDDFRFHDEDPSFERPAGVPELFLPDPVVHQGLTPSEAAAAMTVPDGYRVELVAGEPDLHQPIAFAIDAANRIWVAEAHTYPIRAEDGEGKDRILVLADEDGDGSYESRTVFLDGLNLVSGLAVGHGGVWIGAAPWLLFVPDRDDDLVPDGEPEILLDGWGWQDTHETLNAFTWGPDGWLYGCHGVFTHSLVGAPGTPDEQRVPLNAGVWRFHPVRHEFEVFAHGTSNPWGLDFDARGEAFATACVIPHLWHVVPGARYQRQAGTHFDPDVYEDIGTIADHLHWQGNSPWDGNLRSDAKGGGHAHCGALIYQGGLFPEDVVGSVLMFNIHGNRVNRDTLEPAGSSFVGRHEDDLLLANDTWFRGIALETAPDGSVLFSDWSDERACHYTDPDVWDRSNGRLYRLTHGDSEPWQGDLRTLSDAELVDLHTHANRWFADMARLILAERAAGGPLDTAAAEGLWALAEHDDPLLRLAALWTLHAIGWPLDSILADRLLADRDGSVRAWTIRLVTEQGLESPEFAGRLVHMAAEDPSPVVRRELASRLERVGLGGDGFRVLWALSQRAEDAADANIPLLLWYALKSDVPDDPSFAARLACQTPLPALARLAARRLAELGPIGEEALARRVVELSPDRAGPVLEGWVAGLPPTGTAEGPANWLFTVAHLGSEEFASSRPLVDRLIAYYRAPGSWLSSWHAIVDDPREPLERKQAALDSLKPTFGDLGRLVVLLDQQPELRLSTLRALGRAQGFVADIILERWSAFDAAERREAIAALAQRPSSAFNLLQAMVDGEVDRRELTAATLRSLRLLGDQRVNVHLETLYGSLREAQPAAAETIAAWQAKLTGGSLGTPDLPAGRAVFDATCARCHTLFDAGGEVGPGLTGSHRRDLDYLLENIVDPSAVMGRDQMATNVWTTDGRLVTGVLRAETTRTLTLATEAGDVTLALDDVDERRLSDVSMMPEGLLAALSDREVRDLAAYVQGDAQVPRRAGTDDVDSFFDGVTLDGWRGDPALWSVEDGELVGRTDGLARNAFLRSELDLRDFRLTCEVLLVDDAGNAGIQFRSRELTGGDVAGLQADIGPGWWGKLYDEHGRGLLVDDGAGNALRPGEWNTYVIEAVGSRIRTAINGKVCVELQDDDAAPSGIVAFQLHSGGPTELRVRNVTLELDP